jgi:hypothetical protein
LAKRTKSIDLLKTELEILKANPSLTMSSKGWTQEEYENNVDLLENKIQQSKRGSSSKTKGSNYERDIAKIFKEKLGIDLVRTPMSGGFQKKSEALSIKGDITNLDHTIEFLPHIECKDHTTWALPAWLIQAESDCPKGHIPLVVFHRRQKNKDGKRIQEAGDYVAIKLDDLLDIVDRNKIIIPRTVKKLSKVIKK